MAINSFTIQAPAVFAPQPMVAQTATPAFLEIFADKGETWLGKADGFQAIIPFLNVSTRSQVSQNSNGQVDNSDYNATMLEAPIEIIRARTRINARDGRISSQFNIPDEQIKIGTLKMAIAEQLRRTALVGKQGVSNSGVLNSPNLTTVSLPPDSANNTTWSSYLPADLYAEILSLVATITSNTKQRAKGFKIYTTQAVVAKLKFAPIPRTEGSIANGGATAIMQGADFILYPQGYDPIPVIADDDTMIDASGNHHLLMISPELKNAYSVYSSPINLSRIESDQNAVANQLGNTSNFASRLISMTGDGYEIYIQPDVTGAYGDQIASFEYTSTTGMLCLGENAYALMAQW